MIVKNRRKLPEFELGGASLIGLGSWSWLSDSSGPFDGRLSPDIVYLAFSAVISKIPQPFWMSCPRNFALAYL